MIAEKNSEAPAQREMNKSEYITLLKVRRLGHLERAETLEELIKELGGNSDDFYNSFYRNKNRNEEGEDQVTQNRTKNRSEERISEHVTVDGKPDRRFKENESDALSRSRQQGDDGRGEVTDPENDLRLKENEEKRQELGKKRQTK